MNNPMNKVRYQQFVRQARGANVGEVHVNRVDKRRDVILQYNGRAPKGRQRLTGEWAIPRGERSDEEITAAIQEVLAMLRKDFFVHRGEGLKDDAFADAHQEAEAKPLSKDQE